MILEVSLQEIIDFCGHDGSEIIDKTLADPFCRRAFHEREMADFALLKGLNFTCITKDLWQSPDPGNINVLNFRNGKTDERFRMLIESSYSILCMARVIPHAVACDGKMIYDPLGTIYPLDLLHFSSITQAYIVIKSF